MYKLTLIYEKLIYLLIFFEILGKNSFQIKFYLDRPKLF